MSIRVLLTDSVHPVCPELLAEAGIESVDGTKWSSDQITSSCSDFDGWIIRSGTTIGQEWITKATSLRVIGRAGVGVDNVDIPAATKRGILVLNAPAGNTLSTAEHTMAMLLSIARRIPSATASLKAGTWDRKSFTGSELYGKTLGIVGLGKIGKEVASRAQAFGMRVVGSDPVLTREAAERISVDLIEVDELITTSDFISVHTPLVAATRGLLNDESLQRCKRGVGIINCARGGIVDEAALLRALESGQVGGAGLDVYSSEPPPEDLQQLLAHPNVVCTPHIAASTDEAQEKVARQVTEQVIHALKGEPVQTAVNAMASKMAAQAEVKPYIVLVERLGAASRQLFKGTAESVRIRCHGDVPRRYLDVLRISALKGFLQHSWTESVNLVNAPVIAEEAGIVVDVETFHPDSSYSNQIVMELTGPSGSFKLGGTLFGASDPRITMVDGYGIELRMEGRMLLYRNQDRPGMLAAVGSVLAEAGINIGSMALGRNQPGEEAMTAIAVDQPLGENLLQRLSSIVGVRGLSMLEFMP